MVRLPNRCVSDFAEDGGIAIARAVTVTADHHRFIALRCHFVKEGLVLIRRQSMTRLLCRDGGQFTPDGSVQILSAIEIAADPVQRETLAGELVENGLVLRGSQIVARDP